MNLKLEFKDYLLALAKASNSPASLAVLLAPFGIIGAPEVTDRFLLVGHVLDGIAAEFLMAEEIEPSDVLRIADDLGSDLTISFRDDLAA